MQKITQKILIAFAAMLMLVGCAGAQKDALAEIMDTAPGTPRTEMIKKWGEPKASLFGMFGDIYSFDETNVIVYYTVDENDTALVSEVKTDPAS